ncbi:MAG: cytochrome c maturation protein CcmE [Alteraurantiacibacter sp.]
MSAALKPKHQRLVLLVIALVALIGAGLLAAWALRSQASYFYLPSEIVEHAPGTDEDLRLGGMVEPGSITPQPDGVTIRFVVGDGTSAVPVSFTGIVPALFQENSGVVAEGRMRADGTFVASNLLAKHDENYVPREMAGMSREQARERIEATLQ